MLWARFLRRVVAASFVRALGRVILLTVVVGALPMLALAPLLVLRVAARQPPELAWLPQAEPVGARACLGAGPDEDPACAGPSASTVDRALGPPADVVRLRWLALPAVVILVAGTPLLLRRRALRLRDEYEPLPEGPAGVWAPERRQRALDAEPALAWLPAWLRAALVWHALPQAAFSLFGCGLVMGRAGVELTLSLILCVQASAFAFFIFDDGAARRALGHLLVRLQVRWAARRARGVAEAVGGRAGDLVRLRGTVRSRRHVMGLVEGEPAAVRLTWLRAQVPRRTLAGGERLCELHLTEEAAFDFELVDADGGAVLVDVSDAAWLCRRPAMRRLPAAARQRLPPGPVGPDMRVDGAERLLRDGDTVEVVGYLDSVVDPAWARLAREAPARFALRAGQGRPLLML